MRQPTRAAAAPTMPIEVVPAFAAGVSLFLLALFARRLDLLPIDTPLMAANGRLYWVLVLVGLPLMAALAGQVGAGREQLYKHAIVHGFLAAGAWLLAAVLMAYRIDGALLFVVPVLGAIVVYVATLVPRYALYGDETLASGATLIFNALQIAVLLGVVALVWTARGSLVWSAVVGGLMTAPLFMQWLSGRLVHPRDVVLGLLAGLFVAQLIVVAGALPPGSMLASMLVFALAWLCMVAVRAINAESVSRPEPLQIAIGLGVAAGFAWLLT